MKRAYSVQNLLDAKFKTIDLQGEWHDAIGTPELTGSWFIFGAPKNGKTSFAMKLAKELTKYKRVVYNSVEEGFSLTIKEQLRRSEMKDVKGKFVLIQENIPEMTTFLSKKKSPNVVIIDSIQFAQMNFKEYKDLKKQFPDKLFVFVSHIKGKEPDGDTAKKIWRDANVTFKVEHFRAFPVSRYGGGKPIDVSTEKAIEYFGE